jgi:hypothetical protein
MSIRNLLLSARFLHFLQRKRPSVKREALDVQSGIAYLLQSFTWKQRQHSTEPGCMTISYKGFMSVSDGLTGWIYSRRGTTSSRRPGIIQSVMAYRVHSKWLPIWPKALQNIIVDGGIGQGVSSC